MPILLDTLTMENMRAIHNQTLDILERIGVDFEYQPALSLLRDHGQKVEGSRVRFNPDFVNRQIKKAPESFTLRGRNPDQTVAVGGNHIVFAPGYGAPAIYEADGTRRDSLMDDYDNFVKLAHMSGEVNHTGGNVCEPMDVPDHARHLAMLRSHILYSDKPFMGSAYGEEGAEDSLALADILFGGRAEVCKSPVFAALINSITPLKFDERMLSALMAYAAAGQANVISALVMAGSTGPATLAGTLCVQNAEVLAGIVLAQCVKEGAPVVYGSSSAIADMRTVSLSIGNAEGALLSAASAQLGRFYGLPTRGGGGLNDARQVDAQAGYEAMLTLLNAGLSGIHFCLHAAGILHYYSAMSYEKFVMDEEIIGLAKRYLKGINLSQERFVSEDIAEVGPGGHFLMQESTLAFHRDELRAPLLSDRSSYDIWAGSKKTAVELAGETWRQRLSRYEQPPLDARMAKEIDQYISAKERKG